MMKGKIDRLRILAILIVIAGIFYFYANVFAPGAIPKLIRIGILRRPITLLIVGTDVTFDAVTNKPLPESEGRTDTILLARVDPVRYKMAILSIPRDSFVDIPGHGWQKINAAHVFGGIDLLEKTVTNLTGEKADYFIKINPHAVTQLVDLVGGLEVEIEHDMYYVDRAQNLYINLKKGRRKLSGKEAQGYLRFRHDFYGDIGRIGRQQKFLQSLFRKLASPGNLLKAPLAIQIAVQSVRTDLPLLKIIRLANFARMLSPADIQTFTASGESADDAVAGSIWLINKSELKRITDSYF